MNTNPMFATPLRLAAVCLLTLTAGLAAVRAADANPPDKMTYQGYVVDANGNPLGSTNTGPENYDVIFRIWNDQSATTVDKRLWTEQQTITVDKGYFSILLGEGSAYGSEARPTLSSIFAGSDASDRFVEMTVRGIGAGGADSTILPRTRLLPAPYALLARSVPDLSVTTAKLANGNVTTDKLPDLSVTTAKLANGSVNNLKLSDRSVDNRTLADNSVDNRNLVNLSVNNPKLADHSVNNPKLDSGSVNTRVLEDGSVSSDKLQNGSVTEAKLAAGVFVPVGGIIMWSGTTPPAGWALCNGGNGTPNLQDRFVLAWGTRSIGATGGAATHTLTVNEMPSHTHALNVNTVGYTASWGGSAEATGAPGQPRNNGTQTWSPQNTGGGQPHNNMPPYYVLAFIMRVQ